MSSLAQKVVFDYLLAVMKRDRAALPCILNSNRCLAIKLGQERKGLGSNSV